MILFPAVDIKNGECVRLVQGKEDQVTVFGSDPVAQARNWAALGARYLHVVDLDGAFSGMPKNVDLIKSICTEVDIPVQLGGGIRDIATAEKYIEAGVHRLIIGTMALEEPDVFSELCKALPGRIGVSLDAVDGQLKTKGWVEDAGLTLDSVLPRLEKEAIRFIVYTDIARDGMQTGVNISGLEALCAKTSVPVIAAGGVHTMDDIKALYPLSKKGLEGAISGRALYVGTLDIKEANTWIDTQ